MDSINTALVYLQQSANRVIEAAKNWTVELFYRVGQKPDHFKSLYSRIMMIKDGVQYIKMLISLSRVSPIL